MFAHEFIIIFRNNAVLQHSYIANGLGGKNGAVVIDLRNLKEITVSSSNIATIQTGNRLGNVAVGLNDHGRALPHGTCPYVGIGGHAGKQALIISDISIHSNPQLLVAGGLRRGCGGSPLIQFSLWRSCLRMEP